MKFCDRESRGENKKRQRKRRKCASKNEHTAEERKNDNEVEETWKQWQIQMNM